MSWRRAAALVLWLSLLAPPASPAPRPAAVRQPAPSPGAAADSPARRRTGAPRPAPLSTPAVPPVGAYPPAAPATQAALPSSPAKLRQGPSETVPGTTRGLASWMPARFGPRYLALPQGPGVRVRICGAACLDMASTDAGPSLAMQRAPFGRVADLGAAAWLRVCGLPLSRGLCAVSVVTISR